MKKISVLAVIATAMLLGSCGGAKQAIMSDVVIKRNVISPDVEVALEPCDEYAMEKPNKRAVGMGMHFKEATATNLAQLNARANLAKALQQKIEAATSNYSGGREMFSADEVVGTYQTDQSAKVEDKETGIVKELVRGAAIVKKTRYKTPNNQWKIYVCVEYQEGVAEMATKIAKAFTEKLSTEQKIRIDYDEKKFTEEMKKSLEDYQGLTE
jgi:hypothetical protein